MISNEVAENILKHLKNITKNLPPSTDLENKDPNPETTNDNIYKIRELSARLKEAYCKSAKPLSLAELIKLRNEVYRAKKSYQRFKLESKFEIYLKKDSQFRAAKNAYLAQQILTISPKNPDILVLFTLTEFINNLAHSQYIVPNKIIEKCYTLKDYLLEYLIEFSKSEKNISVTIFPENKTPNASSVINFSIFPKDSIQGTEPINIAWHHKKTPAELMNISEEEFKKLNIHPRSEEINSTFTKDNAEKINEIWGLFSNSQLKFNSQTTIEEHQEFTGGGTYESIPADNNPATIQASDIKTPQIDTQIWKKINASKNPTIKTLKKIARTKRKPLGFNLHEIIRFEILQTAFNEGLINSEELANQELKILNSIIKTAKHPERLEIKSCGKDSKVNNDWDCGEKYFVIRLQPNQMSKPILWEISNDLSNSILQQYPDKIQTTTGRTINSIDNIKLLEKLAAEKEPTTPPSKTSETKTTLFTAQDLDEFLNQPNSQEKLYKAMKSASPETKSLLAAIIYQLVPDSFTLTPPPTKPRKTNRKGGPAHE